jgi:hypothetical protein
VHKKKVSNEIKQHNKEKKLQRESLAIQDVISDLLPNTETINNSVDSKLSRDKKPLPLVTIKILNYHLV